MLTGVRKQTYSATAYVPGKSIDVVMEDYNLTEITKLGSNENNYAPFPTALAAMAAELPKINVYPEKNYVRLKKLLGDKFGLDENWIGLGHGAGNVLDTIAKTFLDDGDEVIIPRQSYNLYKEISWIMGATVKFVELNQEYTVDLKAVQAAITPKTKLIWLCNPNNPTGTLCNKDDVVSLLEALPPHGWLVMDEAYIEFADQNKIPDTIALIKEGYRLMSTRTFSKLYGLAGQRIGYLIANPELVACYDTVSEPFNSNRLGLAGAVATLQSGLDEVETAKKIMIADLKMMAQKLEEMGCTVMETHTNFLFFQTPFLTEEVNELLLRRGVIVRPCDPWGYHSHIRVSVGTTEENMVFLKNIAEVLALLKDGGHA